MRSDPQMALDLGRNSRAAEVVRHRFSSDGDLARRTVVRSTGPAHRTKQTMYGDVAGMTPDEAFDLSWLRTPTKPRYRQKRSHVLRLADLFCGAGGMTLGAIEAGRAAGITVEPVLGADISPHVRRAYHKNFEPQFFQDSPIEEWLDGRLGQPVTPTEAELLQRCGPIDLLMGGPPCQGHSNLNNHTRRDDPKNQLYERMGRFAEVFSPTHVVIENVHGVLHDRGKVVQRTAAFLRHLGYSVRIGTLHGDRVGVPQSRNRVFLVASLSRTPDVDSWERLHTTPARSFDWACSDLPREGSGVMDRKTVAERETKRRIDFLFDRGVWELPDSERPPCHRDNDHRYGSVYGRIRGERPSPTITTGFTVMGQGRFVHPHYRRTLTPREGARLQFFPNWFRFADGEQAAKKHLVTLIGNAVPPKMAYVLALELIR